MAGLRRALLQRGARNVCGWCVSVAFLFSSAALADTNVWIKPTSGSWEEQAYWSLGKLPDSSQSVLFNNPGWKALAINPQTTQDFPGSMSIQGLQLGAPADSYNVLLLNFAGLAKPLQATWVVIGSNSAVVMQASALRVLTNSLDGSGGNVLVGGSFHHGDQSEVTVQGLLDIGRGSHGAYYLTNGSLRVSSELIGRFGNLGTFTQYGGFHSAGTVSIVTDGELQLYGGQLAVTNGINVGSGDFANYSFFRQYGGEVIADTAINGHYLLYGGTIRGKMAVVMPTFQRVDGDVLQAGGTNLATSLDIGQPNRFGGRGFYTLSNGVLRVDSDLYFRGGQFSQYNGINTVASNLFMLGTDVGVGIAYADYHLAGGLLTAKGLTAKGARFQQDGGTNVLSGELVLVGVSPATFGPPQSSSYILTEGLLNAQSVIVDGIFYGGFRQSGGLSQIAQKLTLQGVLPGAYYYTLEGGTLAVKDIELTGGAFFIHTNGTILHSGAITLNQGAWHAAPGEHQLGPLQLLGQNTNSAIAFPDGASILRLAGSSGKSWSPTATLYITNWQGSVAGGGVTRLFFGSDANGLTAQQLERIRFSIAGGVYPAQILATGEVVPRIHLLSFSRSGNTLTLTWEPGWTLQASTNVAGPYEPVQGANSPYPAPMDKPARFFRLQQ